MNDQERIKAAVSLIAQYGDVDGSHHKQWLLDQVLNVLLAPQDYAAFIAAYETPTPGSVQPTISWYAEWDRGIAP